MSTQNKTKVETKTIQPESDRQSDLATAITIAVEMDSNFKLYSFRCIPPETFIERIKELMQFYEFQNKETKLKKS